MIKVSDLFGLKLRTQYLTKIRKTFICFVGEMIRSSKPERP